MDRIIEFIDKMVKNGSLIKWEAMFISELIVIKKYGELSHQSIDDLMVGARIDENEKEGESIRFYFMERDNGRN